ncbi:hypothetical protein AA105894_1177 [Asaia spathodeae NBRC 105894]|nr:hypothetical protein AA105894_1177 [Asaia spathodeae NBRC 105894]
MNESCPVIGAPAMGDPYHSGQNGKAQHEQGRVMCRTGCQDDKGEQQPRDGHEELQDRIMPIVWLETGIPTHSVYEQGKGHWDCRDKKHGDQRQSRPHEKARNRERCP